MKKISFRKLSKWKKAAVLTVVMLVLLVSYPVYHKYSEYQKWHSFDQKLAAIGGTYQYDCPEFLKQIARNDFVRPYNNLIEPIAYPFAWRQGLICENVSMTDELFQVMPVDDKIKQILLWDTEVTEKCLQHASKFKNLVSISITDCNLSSEAINELRKLPKLNRVLFRNVTLTDEAMEALAKCKNLNSLELYNCTISEKGMGEIPNLIKLNNLEIHRMPIGDDFIKQLVNCKELNSLRLQSTITMDDYVEDLKKLKVQHLSVRRKNFSTKNIKTLSETFEQLNINEY